MNEIKVSKELCNGCRRKKCCVKEFKKIARKELIKYLEWLRKSNEQYRLPVDAVNSMIEDKIDEEIDEELGTYPLQEEKKKVEGKKEASE